VIIEKDLWSVWLTIDGKKKLYFAADSMQEVLSSLKGADAKNNCKIEWHCKVKILLNESEVKQNAK